MIEQLDMADREQAVEVLAVAFKDHPMMPPDPTGRRARSMMGTMLGAFAKAPDVQLFGIRSEGKLACAAFVFADGYDPPRLQQMKMMYRMLRSFGIRRSITFIRVMSQKRKGEGRRLELLLLGTRADQQGRGHGRAMIRHVFSYARELGYDSVVLEVAKHTPAFGFYQREGFVLEREIELPVMPLCLMTRPLDPKT
jgi:ribosomal protein S18 acetylase RimI-like enzyme